MESEVMDEVRKLPQYEALLQSLEFFQESAYDEERVERIAIVRKCLLIINGWIDMLTKDEQFVVRSFIIEDLDWNRIVIEHEKIWGENARSIRSLQRCLKSAKAKICSQASRQISLLIEIGLFDNDAS